jgi:hypothetical protein
MTDPLTTTRILDSVARVCMTAIDDLAHAFAAGVTDEITELEPDVVALADDFTETGLPMVTLTLGKWAPALQPGNERLTLTVEGNVWRSRVPLGVNTAALYADRDALADAFMEHTKAFAHEPAITSAILQGGPGIVPRAIPRGLSERGTGARLFLTLPFTVEVKTNRIVRPQPA